MRFILIFIVTAIFQYFTPWWTIALVPFLANLWKPTAASRPFLTSFAAIATLWFVYGLYLHINSEGAMSNRIAELFSLPNGILLLFISSAAGGLVGGFGGLSGYYIRQIYESIELKQPVAR